MQNKQAFTLIELLIVVLIIGILAAVAVPQYQKAVEKSRATEGLILVKAIKSANDVYYLANGNYSQTLDELDISIPGIDITHHISNKIQTIETPYFQCRTQNNNTTATYSAFCRRTGKGYYIGYYLPTNQFLCGSNLNDIEEGTEWCKLLTGKTEPIAGFTRRFAFEN